MKLRQGRRVSEHVYLQSGPEPSDDDRPLFTLPTAELARWLVAAVELGELCHEEQDVDAAFAAYEAYRAAREAIR